MPWFYFDGSFLDEKLDSKIANFHFFKIIAKLMIFQKFPRVTIFKVEGCAFGF